MAQHGLQISPSPVHPDTVVQQGQGMVEYALVLAIVSVVAVVILTVMGDAVGDIFGEMSCTLERGSAQEQINPSLRGHYASETIHWAAVWDESSWNRLMDKTNEHYSYLSTGCYVYIDHDTEYQFVEDVAESNLSSVN